MTTTAADPSTAQIDLYREIHKGLRLALFELVQRAGALDPTDASDVESFQSLFADLDMMLVTHHGHEDGAELAALISLHAADVESSVSSGHDRAEQQMDELRSVVAGLGRTGSADVLYDLVVVFVADYLDHMQVEEKQIMPRLQAGATGEELMSLQMAIRTSVPPPDMCVFLRSMLPAMNPDERTSTLGGMQAGAPPEIFQLFWGVAEAHLAPSELAVIADRLSVPSDAT